MDTGENKKVSLEELSKEDLIKKCRSLLSLAQKAKVDKVSLQEENEKLKKELCEKTENHQGATSEILEKLTEEKLLLVTQIEDLKLKNNALEGKLDLSKAESRSANEKLCLFETENISFNRQVKRLTDENENLYMDISSLEMQITELKNISIRQEEQLVLLEKTNENNLKELQLKLSNSLEEVKKLNISLKSKENEIKDLSQEIQALKIIKNNSVQESNKNCDHYIKENTDLKRRNEIYSKEILDIQNMNEKLKGKVKLYHSKLKKFALTIKEIKDEKNQIIQIHKAYTEQIKEWKEQLLSASEQLVKLINDLENENKVLKEGKKVDGTLTNLNLSDDLMKTLETYEHGIQGEGVEDFYKAIKETQNQYDSQTKNLTQELFNYKEQLDTLNEQLILKEKCVEEALKIKEKYELENKNLIESLFDYKKKMDIITHQLTSKGILLNDASETEEKCDYNKSLNKILDNFEEITNVNQILASEQTTLKQENTKLNETIKQSLNTEKLLAEKSSEEIIWLTKTIKELEEKLSNTQNELHKIKNKSFQSNFVQTDDDFDSNQEKGMYFKRENSELLLEMNQMNQALKERGEIISKLEAHCEELKKRLQVYETQANKNVDSITKKEETIKALAEELETLRKENFNVDHEHQISSKDNEIATLKIEIESLRDKLHNSIDNSYAESETMSTSTISKSEESNRLKDLEGSWEERYVKLRTLAVKLKAKIRENGISITELQTEKEELQKKQSNNLKTILNLQGQIDSLQDNLDKVVAENKQYLSKLNSVAENISKDKQLLVENEETIGELRKEIEGLHSEKQNVETWKKQVGAKVQVLRKELEAKKVIIKEFEDKVSKLEGDLESKDLQLANEQESHKKTKALLDQISSENKKNSVLNLEMQDYERSVKELSQKVEKQKEEINNLQTQFDLQKCTINALREQNKLLEERMQEEEKNGNTTSLEISSFKKNIVNLEEVLQQKENKILDITRLMETIRSENEELSTELSKVITEHQKSLNMVKSERDHLRNQILSVQQSLRESQDLLKLKEDEVFKIREDYETYKVRAQSVLKKNQNRDLGLEEKILEELATLKSLNSELTDELQGFREKLKDHQIATDEIVKERDTFKKKCQELQNDVVELKTYSEQLSDKYQKAVSEHADTVRNLKVHAETLSQCYRQQMSEQEVRHNREIIELQSRLDKTPSPVETTPVHPNMPREEGEGSESIESNSLQNNVHPIPLERLLDSKSDDEGSHLKKQLVEQESKIVHLTALLSDTEQDLVKHVQMNKLLKEEIRRQQRSVEREKHAENLEYLKNVVFKFITLNSVDERTRLVPVLNTILKLSPEETQKLIMVAKGDPGIKGWSSYLPMWSSPNRPQ